MAISDKPWSSVSQSDYKDAGAYCSACLVDANPSGQAKIKSNCHLPVREPGGMLNRNGVHAAAARLAGAGGGTKLSPAQKKEAARKLMRLYGELKDTPPDSLKQMAGM